MHKKWLRLACLSLCGFGCSAWAHDLWFEPEGRGWVLYQGHRHSTHSGADVVPYAPGMVKSLRCADAPGSPVIEGLSQVYPARIEGDCAVVHALFSSGYWTKTAWDTRNLPKTGIAGVLKSWYSEESLKLIARWQGSAASPLGQGLELTPASNPLLLKTGDKLVVLVTDAGKPVAGVPVAYAGETRGASGADGKVAIRLRRGGVQLLEASLESPLTDGKADVAIRTTSLQFWIAP